MTVRELIETLQGLEQDKGVAVAAECDWDDSILWEEAEAVKDYGDVYVITSNLVNDKI